MIVETNTYSSLPIWTNTIFGKGSDRRTDAGGPNGPVNPIGLPEGSCQELYTMQAV